ncbi:MAG: hypothetical protein ABI222_00425 [Opitutaceae bacterium]
MFTPLPIDVARTFSAKKIHIALRVIPNPLANPHAIMKTVITSAIFTLTLAIASAAPATIASYLVEGKSSADLATMTPDRLRAEAKREWSFTAELPVGLAISNQYASPGLKVDLSVRAQALRKGSDALKVHLKFHEERAQQPATGNSAGKSDGELELIVRQGQSVIFGSRTNTVSKASEAGIVPKPASGIFYLLTLGEVKS